MSGCKRNKIIVWSLVVAFVLMNVQPGYLFAQSDMSEPFGEESVVDENSAESAEKIKQEEALEGVIDSKDVTEISILRGELATVKVYSLTRLSITNPSIADVASVDADKMMIVGKTIGQTPFFIWDEYGKRTIIVRVYEENLLYVKNRVTRILQAADIKDVKLEENLYEGKVMLIGELPKDKLDELNAAIAPFAGSLVNLVKEETSEDLIQIDMQVAELNTTLQKSLGFDWTAGSASSLQLTYSEEIPTDAANQLERFVKIGDFTRTSALLLTINNLLEEGNARILSKPRVLVVSGKEARFQVGGQYPIQSTSTSAAGTATESVSFKDYGIIMTITPTITKGKVSIELTMEISDIDSSVSTSGQGSVAFTNRSASTSLLLDDLQTIVLAGLIKTNKNTTYKKVPFLGDIPLVGLLFRSKSTPAAEKETEVVITLTPTIIPQVYEDKDKKEAAEAKSAKAKTSAPVQEEAVVKVKDVSVPSDSSIAEDAAAEEERAQDYEMNESAAAEEAGIENTVGETGMEEATMEESAMEDAPMAASSAEIAEGMDQPEITFEEDMPALSEDVSQVTASYVKSIQKKISEAITFPYEASEEGWSGTVKLVLHILKDGTLDDVAVRESSGYQVFDKDAVNTAQILAPYGAFPPELTVDELKIVVPIVYSQGSAAIDVVCRPKHKIQQVSNKPFSFSSGKTYAEMIQERIAKSILYPDQARQRGWEGTVKLNLQILRDGTLANASVKESSGNKMFDECALQTAKTLAPYSVFPPESELQDLRLTVPIIFNLEK